MLLSSLAKPNDGLTLAGADPEISGITVDSRKVQPGYLFMAVPGLQQDGRLFIHDAIQAGAAAVLVPQGTARDALPGGIGIMEAKDVRKAVSLIASRFFPLQPEVVVAITGTSGKTSTAQFVREIWNASGHKAASIGTLGFIEGGVTRYGPLTTPDPITLHSLLDESASKGVTRLSMEASSHGLILNRLDHVAIKIAAFTNLSRDHLDYHQTMEAYFAAKLRLFKDLLMQDGFAVLNADVSEFAPLREACAPRGEKIIRYGRNGVEIKLLDQTPDALGQRLKVEVFGKTHDILFPVIGSFQAWNALCALGCAVASGEDPSNAVACLEKLSGVPGRLELIGETKNGGAVFVDFAHKPDALEQVLKAMRPHVDSYPGARLHVLFGCGGNRDKGKRPIMGEIAQTLADYVTLTDDNPRNENPASIRQDILEGCISGTNLSEIGDRGVAIKVSMARLQKGDVLVIAGKGHEKGQIVGDKILPFEDADVVRRCLAEG